MRGPDQDAGALDRAFPFEELVPIRLLQIDDEDVGLSGVDHIFVHLECTLRADGPELKLGGAGADDMQTEDLPCARSDLQSWPLPWSSAWEA